MTRRRLHLTDPCHRACEVYEGLEGTDCFLATQGNPSEAFEFIEETLNEVTLLVEHPVSRAILAAGRVALDMCGGTKIFGDESTQVIGIVGRIHDDVLGVRQPLDQAQCLWAVAPLAGCDREPDRQAKGIDGGVDFGGQTAFGAANTGSFKPPF